MDAEQEKMLYRDFSIPLQSRREGYQFDDLIKHAERRRLTRYQMETGLQTLRWIQL